MGRLKGDARGGDRGDVGRYSRICHLHSVDTACTCGGQPYGGCGGKPVHTVRLVFAFATNSFPYEA
eukprot:3586753-Pyramimonas_sp.AAC.2